MANPPALDRIFICSGQSNMSGRAPLAGAPAHGDLSNVWLFKPNGTWENPPTDPANDPTDATFKVLADVNSMVGPILYFADRWTRFFPTQKIGLVPCAKGGRSISAWSRSLLTNTIYGATLVRALAADDFGPLSGVIFFQGEADCNTTTDRDAWYAAFQQLVTDWRSDFATSDLAIVAAILGPFREDRQVTSPYGDDMRVIQSRINIPRVATVPNYDATLYDDVHLDAASAQRCGFRMADAMRMLGV